jgi:nicotinate dehydrogenase subunit B
LMAQSSSRCSSWLKSQPVASSVVLDQPADTPTDLPRQTFRADYERPYPHHASIGLSCALAQWRGSTLQVWSHSQGIFNLRRDLALAFGMAPESILVSHCDAAGCYGHSGADNVAFDASWLARKASGRPVRVQWAGHGRDPGSGAGRGRAGKAPRPCSAPGGPQSPFP